MDVDQSIVEHEPVGPQPILRLDKDVVNQIAAAEIIQRPSNAIKELIENSLDAGATSIRVVLKDGGLKSMQITDNGHGINKSDLPLLCTRYATSKLRAFSDLQSLVTYGFRGEALASISYCAHVEVITKTKADSCGWKYVAAGCLRLAEGVSAEFRATYSDGELAARGIGSADPRPTAANDGTTITAEDLFYNMPQRKRAFRSASDEYARVLEVITKYAVHNPHAAWVCKKTGTALPDVSTPPGSTTRANISLLYTPALAADLLEVERTDLEPITMGASCRGWVSSANASWTRRGGWLLFINNRLVDSSKIKRAIESLYTVYLPKGSSPFVYLSLDIDPAKVDVNVHPTKAEVHFLNEDEVVEGVVAAVSIALAGANRSRTFTVQTLLPGAEPADRQDLPRTQKPAPNYKVRMDPANRTLDSMIAMSHPSQVGEYSEPPVERPTKRRAVSASGADAEAAINVDSEANSLWDAEPGFRSKDVPESVCGFESITELRKRVKQRANAEMCDVMQKHAFVGIVHDHGKSLVQQGTRLYLVDHVALSREHFYQLALRQFGALGRIKLEPAPPLRDLLHLAASQDEDLATAGLKVDAVVASLAALLSSKRAMIDEYFSLVISATGDVVAIPMVLKDYTPNLDGLPRFLLCAAMRVAWDTEQECFDSLLQELAGFYSSDAPRDTSPTADPASVADEAHREWQLEHVLFPSFRRTLWPKETKRLIQQVANLPDLFRVFERC